MSTEERVIPFGLAFTGLGLVALSMFLPYLDESSVTFSRIAKNTLLQNGNGWITLVAAGACAISLLRALTRPPQRIIWPFISGAVVLGYAIYAGTDEGQRTLCPLGATTVTSACSVASPGIGIYVLGLGGASLIASGVFFWRLPPKRDPENVPAADPMAVTRECPHCKSQIRPDASVCPHCQRDSEPWKLNDNVWWLKHGDVWLWYDQETEQWQPPDPVDEEIPATSGS